MSLAHLEPSLREGLRAGELNLWYQPVVDLENRQLSDLEALMRWPRSPPGASPAAMIAAAERTDLIHDVGRWVLDSACSQLARWRAHARWSELTVSVNVSPRQLTRPELAAHIAASLDAADLAGSALRLEITEGLPISDLDQAVRSLDEIRGLGVRVSVDEFGTGFSTRPLLERLPIDRIKIARAWVGRLTLSAEYRGLVGEVIGYAHTAGLDAVGEGIETAEQLAALVELGCVLGQGNHLWPAMSAAEFDKTFGADH